MTNKLNPEQLKDQERFDLIKTLSHDEIIQFVMNELRKLRWPMVIFYGINIILLSMIIAFSLTNIIHSYISWGLYWQFLLLGIFSGMILVIPVHELLHGLAYKLAGASKVKFGADIRQMLFYASAPSFVAGKKAFFMVAFFPFVIINLVFLSGILLGSPPVQWASLVALFIHTTMCIGDFAMVNFFAAYPGKKVYTYDNPETRTSFFYLKK